MTSSFGSTERKERRAWPSHQEHFIILSRLLDDGYSDKVTGLRNKQYLSEVVEPQIEASRKFDFPLSLVALEIAHFHQIRFTFGDKSSDRILAETARLIKSRVRASDLVVRTGDFSFAILLLHANKLGAEIVCRRLRDLLGRHPFPGGGSDTMLTVNFGAAEQENEFDQTGNDLMARAGQALAKASKLGTGEIVIAGINL
jgi:diguanylate cyclase (GGDEF)-like protein